MRSRTPTMGTSAHTRQPGRSSVSGSARRRRTCGCWTRVFAASTASGARATTAWRWRDYGVGMRDVAEFLAGRWTVDRQLSERDAQGTFAGVAEFTRDGDGL